MNRQIKFRAWDKETKIMEEVYSLHRSGNCHVRNGNRMLTEDNFEVMQFTGLLDKNGKEIYEGDILKIFRKDVSANPEDGDGKFYLVEIKYHGAEFSAEDLQTHGNWHWGGWQKHEIVGNIYENPELLK